ncbi:MAG TPA: TlpA disulfide reductase family protein [Dehalococcoidia bacterium]|nr:TlpA disulfide reductase family protein [Dehalococcoidia bacterium]
MTDGRGRPLRLRLLSLAGLLVIVGAVIGGLMAAGLIGSQGGGTTSSGVKIRDAQMLETPRPPGVGDFQVGAVAGKFAPEFEVSRMDNGERVRLSEFRGHPVYLNFWASWCIPCAAEIPDIAQLQRDHPDLVVIGANLEEPLARAQGFLAGIDLKDGSKGFRYVVPAMDPSGALYKAYNPFPRAAPPLSIFIDPQGRVTQVYGGQLGLVQMQDFYARAATGSS